MQIKEFKALTLKECLQQVREDMGPEAVILETRKFRRGGLLGMGAKDAVCIVAATGITVQDDLPVNPRREAAAVAAAASVPVRNKGTNGKQNGREEHKPRPEPAAEPVPNSRPAANQAARAAYARAGIGTALPAEPPRAAAPLPEPKRRPEPEPDLLPEPDSRPRNGSAAVPPAKAASSEVEAARFASLERAMQEIREGLLALKQQQEAHVRTVTAVVTAAAPRPERVEVLEDEPRFPELHRRLLESGVSVNLAEELLDGLPNFDAWSDVAQMPLAEAALRDIMSRRIPCAGPIVLTPGQLKAVAMIGPTGVGKTTTIAKLAAHFSLVQGKKVALLTVDTYRIAAVEQLKTYSQIIDIPIRVAYSQAEVMTAIAEFAGYDLLLIDTAGRSQKNIMQVGELKALLEALRCETHLVLSAPVKENDMIEAARRFSAACVDRILFSKLDETSSYGTLLNVADRTGIPLSYLTTGQKVPEDLETADGKRLAELILGE